MVDDTETTIASSIANSKHTVDVTSSNICPVQQQGGRENKGTKNDSKNETVQTETTADDSPNNAQRGLTVERRNDQPNDKTATTTTTAAGATSTVTRAEFLYLKWISNWANFWGNWRQQVDNAKNTRSAFGYIMFWTVVASPLFVLLVTLPWILAAPVSVIIGLLFCVETASTSTSNCTGKQWYERSTDDNEQKVIEDRDINNASWRSNETASTGDSTGTQWYQRSKDSRGGGSPSTRTSPHRDLACIFKFAMERLVVVPTLVLFSFPLCVLLYCRIVLQMLKGTTWPNNDNDSDRDWKQEEHWDYHWDYAGDWDEVLLDLMKLGNQFYDQQILNNLRCWYHIHLRFYTLLGATWSGYLVDTAMTPLFLTRLLVCIVLSLPIAVLYTAKILLYYARQVMNALPGRLLQDAFTLAFGSLVGRYLRTIIVQLPLLLGTMLVLSSMFLPLLPVTYIAVVRMAMHYERYRSS